MNSVTRKRAFRELRGEMSRQGITQEDIAKIAKRSSSYIDARFAGAQPWSIKDAYVILRALRLPVRAMTRYFPENIYEEVTAG